MPQPAQKGFVNVAMGHTMLPCRNVPSPGTQGVCITYCGRCGEERTLLLGCPLGSGDCAQESFQYDNSWHCLNAWLDQPSTVWIGLWHRDPKCSTEPGCERTWGSGIVDFKVCDYTLKI